MPPNASATSTLIVERGSAPGEQRRAFEAERADADRHPASAAQVARVDHAWPFGVGRYGPLPLGVAPATRAASSAALGGRLSSTSHHARLGRRAAATSFGSISTVGRRLLRATRWRAVGGGRRRQRRRQRRSARRCFDAARARVGFRSSRVPFAATSSRDLRCRRAAANRCARLASRCRCVLDPAHELGERTDAVAARRREIVQRVSRRRETARARLRRARPAGPCRPRRAARPRRRTRAARRRARAVVVQIEQRLIARRVVVARRLRASAVRACESSARERLGPMPSRWRGCSISRNASTSGVTVA